MMERPAQVASAGIPAASARRSQSRAGSPKGFAVVTSLRGCSVRSPSRHPPTWSAVRGSAQFTESVKR